MRDIAIQNFNANERLTAIKKILSLEQGKQYKDVLELRNGLVIVMVDQGHKGAHIKGFQEQDHAIVLLPARVQSMEGLELPYRMENQIL